MQPSWCGSRRSTIANVLMDEGSGADNLAVALCSYYDSHPHKPVEDEYGDSGWTVWVEMMANAALDRIVGAAELEVAP